ncbi:hypothetical protein EJ07DRAFT_169286 [Lizonia empirigonia]|nr:hypothetical protein EJ07DRAFT_169286 [Lizonia empirigonia]
MEANPPKTIPLPTTRLPDYPNVPLTLDAKPLSIYDENSFTQDTFTPPTPSTPPPSFSIPTALATILHAWHPTTLLALLDLDAWFSLTWTATCPGRTYEIGRVGTQISFGTLDASGENWAVLLTYNIAVTPSAGVLRGAWVARPRECILGAADVVGGEEVDRLAARWVGEVLGARMWEARKGVRHAFCVEYAPMDVFGDGIKMSPHWLYAALELGRCAGCGGVGSLERPLDRCGRCGTAAYCGDGGEERGIAIRVSERGGLYKWDVGRTMVGRDEVVESENPHFETVQLKRRRSG